MPFDTFGDTSNPGGVYGQPRFAAMPRLLMLNPQQLADVVTRPNPSSQVPWSPVSNLWTPSRYRPWVTRGYFCITSETTKGYEMAPNWELDITDSGGNTIIDCRDPAATTTHYQDPAHLAAVIENRLNASGTLNGTYSVVYDDERQSASPTYKFTISCNETFTVNSSSSSIADTLKLTTGGGAATSITSTGIVCHTEEYIILQMAPGDGDGVTLPPPLAFNSNANTVATYPRWLVFVDANFDMTGASMSSTAGGDKINVYTGTRSNLQASADSAFTDGTSVFHLGSQSGKQDGTAYEWSDAGFWLRDFSGSGYKWPCRYYVVDLGAWYQSNNGGTKYSTANPEVRIKIVNRGNGAGRLSFGRILLGMGWFPKYAPQWPFNWGIVEDAARYETMAGSIGARRYGARRVVEANWDATHMSDNDIVILQSLIAGLQTAASATGTPRSQLHAIARKDEYALSAANSVCWIDPGMFGDWVPPQAAIGTETEYARGCILGTPEFGNGPTQRFKDLWNWSLRIIEETL